MALPRLLSVAEINRETGLPVRTVYDLIARGELAAIRYGETRRACRIHEDDVREWIESHREVAR